MSDKKPVHGEIEYIRENGEGVHSDICPPNCDFDQIAKEYRQFLHDVLDEWLNKSRGTGCFHIQQEGWEP